jgi:phosphotransferase system HPr (HPr) family protein
MADYNIHREGEYWIAKNVEVKLLYGFCARPSALFSRECIRFKGEVLVEKDGNEVDGESIMELMTLEAGLGSKLTIKVKDKIGARDLITRLCIGTTTTTNSSKDLYPDFEAKPSKNY